MICVEKNDRINFLVENFLIPNQKLRDLDPIVAGGSIVYLYLLEKACQQDFHWNLLVKNIKSNVPIRPGGLLSGSFSDIDIWFADDNEVFKDDNEYHKLVCDHPEKDTVEGNALFDTRKSIPKFDALGLSTLLTSTQWANTFEATQANGDYNRFRLVNHQFIKRPVSLVEDLLSGFDFKNCMMAWKDGEIYYESAAMDAFNNGTLELNNGGVYDSGTLPSKVFNALRAFKYSKRYQLDFGASLTEHVFKVFVDCNDIDFKAYNEKAKVEYINSAYGLSRSTVNTFRSTVFSLASMFPVFLAMKNFKQEHALFLVDNAKGLRGLREYIDNGGVYVPGSESGGDLPPALTF